MKGESMKRTSPGSFAAYKRSWKATTLVDIPGPGSFEEHRAKVEFIEALPRLFPEMMKAFREAFFDPMEYPQDKNPQCDEYPMCMTGHCCPAHQRPRRRKWKPISRAKQHRRALRVRAFLAEWNLNVPWVFDEVVGELPAWTVRGRRTALPEVKWRMEPSYDFRADMKVPAFVEYLPWDPIMWTEAEVRESFESHLEDVKRAAFEAGLVPRPTKVDVRSKVGQKERSEMLVLYLVGGMAYEKIAEWFQRERALDLHISTVETAVRSTAALLAIELPPKQGRRRKAVGRTSEVNR